MSFSEDWRGGGLACLATQSLGSAPATLHMNNFGETFDTGNTVTTCTLKRLPFVLTGRLDRSVHATGGIRQFCRTKRAFYEQEQGQFGEKQLSPNICELANQAGRLC